GGGAARARPARRARRQGRRGGQPRRGRRGCAARARDAVGGGARGQRAAVPPSGRPAACARPSRGAGYPPPARRARAGGATPPRYDDRDPRSRSDTRPRRSPLWRQLLFGARRVAVDLLRSGLDHFVQLLDLRGAQRTGYRDGDHVAFVAVRGSWHVVLLVSFTSLFDSVEEVVGAQHDGRAVVVPHAVPP